MTEARVEMRNCLALCDGGEVRAVQDREHSEETLENDFHISMFTQPQNIVRPAVAEAVKSLPQSITYFRNFFGKGVLSEVGKIASLFI